jgi:DNA-binding transcriptional regulator YiaG
MHDYVLDFCRLITDNFDMATKRQTASTKAKTIVIRRSGRGAQVKLLAKSPNHALSVTSLRKELGLNRKLFSRLTGYSERALAKWEAGEKLSGASLQKMIEMGRLQQGLAAVMKSDFIPQWLQTPNDAFDGLKPIEVVERGEIDRIWHMVYELESGMPG